MSPKLCFASTRKKEGRAPFLSTAAFKVVLVEGEKCNCCPWIEIPRYRLDFEALLCWTECVRKLLNTTKWFKAQNITSDAVHLCLFLLLPFFSGNLLKSIWAHTQMYVLHNVSLKLNGFTLQWHKVQMWLQGLCTSENRAVSCVSVSQSNWVSRREEASSLLPFKSQPWSAGR